MPLIDLPAFAPDLLADFERLKTLRVDTPVIQPAEPFLDMAGEDLRRRIFMTASETGESLCLRPEFTIPVCLRHIETATGTPQRYAYLGEVFRQRRDGSNEFYQAGIEDLGDPDTAGADARAIGDAMLVAANRLPGRRLKVTLGDQSVFEAVIAACGLPAGWQKRLIHAFGDQKQLQRLLGELADPKSSGVFGPEVERLAGMGILDDVDRLVAEIAGIMEATGYSTNASRSPGDIARRLKEKMALAATKLDPAALAVMREFLALDLPLADAPEALRQFATESGLKIGDALALFDARVAALAKSGADVDVIRYRAAFGRPLDYYTGLVFEIELEGTPAVLAGGGRFDRLLTLLGAQEHIPAVGFSLWLDRIERAMAAAGDAK
ncbi:ATP phosphoribosyltransferase regulatory subunit [Sinorhizobium alkalisoli]|uniref:ATP phosphoribosyltransferase regulatory subunit n=1 Tax=Sinorhizobium alkalisoli TaxID=1752398 RepID=A0A1E3V5J5_9HYPH|nr:ATP phosphoribosyltransferase regulatory subunit [Sinorhizobium alkalisoli]MCG5479921.1 ATP phosphoribosyltransferase regulatory subunit [Sinorhizobium alkalisoli]ODR88904.1 ATP phosphoribosyltransferase regulatory subunit [Sinorhizobium alkalisoli]QFI65272.1 ATP phosphoribosyltransferase regulatory subunit [Sinorhizobium alkalisoli]